MVQEKLDHVYKFTTLDSGNHLVWHWWQASTNGEWGGSGALIGGVAVVAVMPSTLLSVTCT